MTMTAHVAYMPGGPQK